MHAFNNCPQTEEKTKWHNNGQYIPTFLDWEVRIEGWDPSYQIDVVLKFFLIFFPPTFLFPSTALSHFATSHSPLASGKNFLFFLDPKMTSFWGTKSQPSIPLIFEVSHSQKNHYRLHYTLTTTENLHCTREKVFRSNPWIWTPQTQHQIQTMVFKILSGWPNVLLG